MSTTSTIFSGVTRAASGSRPAFLCLALAVPLFLQGCAALTVDPAKLRNPAQYAKPAPSSLLVVPARFEPKLTTDERLLRGKGAAGAEGAARGALGGAVLTMATNPFLFILLPITVPIYAMSEGAAEASMAASTEAIEKGGPAIERALAELGLQERMKRSLMAELLAEAVAPSISADAGIGPAAADERPTYSGSGAPMALEVAVLDFGFGFVQDLRASEGRSGFTLDLRTRARLVDTVSGTVLDEMTRLRRSDVLTATEWLEGGAEGVQRAVETAIEATARDIVLEFFRLYYPPYRPPVEGRVAPYWVLQPIEPLQPPAATAFKPRDVFVSHAERALRWQERRFAVAESLQPTLRWETFPREIDLGEEEAGASRFSDVSYELAVFEATRKWFGSDPRYVAGRRVYARAGLAAPAHRIEEPLTPCGRYAWTVRARFELDGKPRVTEWMVTQGHFWIGGAEGLPWWMQRRSHPSVEATTGWSSESTHYYFLFRAPPAEGVESCD